MLNFENWLSNQNFSATSKNIFQEAIICYRAQAYRASMVMSYIGFINVLKERMLISTVPSGINPAHWTNILRDIQDDDKWDAVIKDATQQKNPAPVFPISDDLRQQIIYWKNRRNDCAHYKTNDIEYYHIETFWKFLENNLPKLIVNGSFNNLTNRIKDHFDVSLTPPGQDFSPLIQSIDSAITQTELNSFFVELHRIFQSYVTFISTNDLSDNEISFYREIFQICGDNTKNALTIFLKSNNNYLIDFLRVNADLLHIFNLEDAFIRRLWFTLLFSNHNNDFSIYCALLNNNKIQAADLNEANNKVFSRLKYSEPNSDYEKTLLVDNGFFDIAKQKIFIDGNINDFYFINDKAELVTYFVEKFPLETEVVRRISESFSRDHFATRVASKLNDMFATNPTKKQEFINIAHQNNISLPTKLPAISEP